MARSEAKGLSDLLL